VRGGRSAEPQRRSLSPAERIAGLGAIVAAGGLMLPWYGIPFGGGLSVTGLDSFGFANAALLLTLAAALTVIAREAAGRPPARPLRAAELVAIAGGWAALLSCYLMIDRPDQLAGTTHVGLRIGVFVSLGGCVAVVVGGLRMRVERGTATTPRT
jgi:hypothetical protein